MLSGEWTRSIPSKTQSNQNIILPNVRVLPCSGSSPELQECCQGARAAPRASVQMWAPRAPTCPFHHYNNLHCRADDCHCPQCLAGPQNCSLWLNLMILPLLLHMDSLTAVVLNLNIAVFLLTDLTLAFLVFFSWYRSCSLLLQPFTPYKTSLTLFMSLPPSAETSGEEFSNSWHPVKKKIPSQPWHYLKEKKNLPHSHICFFITHARMSAFVCAAAEVTKGETEIFLTAEYLQIQTPWLKETNP